MDRPRRDSRQHNGITVRGLSQLTSATKSAISGRRPAASVARQEADSRSQTLDLCWNELHYLRELIASSEFARESPRYSIHCGQGFYNDATADPD
jgi:hypothetical protein